MTLDKYSKELISILNRLTINQNEQSTIERNIKSHLNNNNNSLAFEYLLNIISKLDLDVNTDLKNKIYVAGQFIEMDDDLIDELMEPLPKINLQSKTVAKKGEASCYWFENKNIGLKRTLYHRFKIPLEPFDSGLEYLPQPEETTIVMEWIQLNINDPFELDDVNIVTVPEDDTQSSVYIGTRHNPCDIKKMILKKIEKDLYRVTCELFVEFEYESVAKNEYFNFTTMLQLNPDIKEE